jgi:hypothetical protein
MGVTFHKEDPCFDCHSNCITMLTHCNCAQYGGGECAYTQSGLLKKYHIDKVGSYFAFFILWMLIVWNLCIVA